MSADQDSTPQCSVCGDTLADHGGRAHRFSLDGKVSKVQEAPAPRKISTPSDPVLRMLLVAKGVITPEDLTAMEQQLLAAGAIRNF